jgi:hypothetical protein
VFDSKCGSLWPAGQQQQQQQQQHSQLHLRVVPVVHCIRLIPAAMHVCAVAEMVLAAVELRRVESSSSAVSCVVQLRPKLSLQVASDVCRRAAELLNARVCKQLHCNWVLVIRILTSQAPRKVCRPRSGACCPSQTVTILALQPALRQQRYYSVVQPSVTLSSFLSFFV